MRASHGRLWRNRQCWTRGDDVGRRHHDDIGQEEPRQGKDKNNAPAPEPAPAPAPEPAPAPAPEPAPAPAPEPAPARHRNLHPLRHQNLHPRRHRNRHRSGTRTGTRSGTRTGTRSGTRTGARPGTRTCTRPGTRTCTRPGASTAASGNLLGYRRVVSSVVEHRWLFTDRYRRLPRPLRHECFGSSAVGDGFRRWCNEWRNQRPRPVTYFFAVSTVNLTGNESPLQMPRPRRFRRANAA
jgi:hypothetical protein